MSEVSEDRADRSFALVARAEHVRPAISYLLFFSGEVFFADLFLLLLIAARRGAPSPTKRITPSFLAYLSRKVVEVHQISESGSSRHERTERSPSCERFTERSR